jgi:MFS family permease
MEDPSTRPPARPRRTFAALQHPNYRLWFWGQMVSLFGTWMQMTAQGFLIFEITHSPIYLGYVGFAAGIPTWLFTLYGGVVADRVPRRNLLVITQMSMMALAFILAGLAFLNLVQPWHILVLAALLGIANSFDAPARQAFVNELVPPEDLTNAIALNSTMFHSATAVGPAVAGAAYALFGPGWCFLINGVSFIAVIAALKLMRLTPTTTRAAGGADLRELLGGIRYAVTHPVVRVLIGLVAATSMFTLSFSALMPAWAVTVLGGDAALNGVLFSARGVGSLCGAMLIATLGRITYRGRILMVGALAYPVFFLLFTFARSVPLALFLLGCTGLGSILVLNLSNAIVQTSTPPHLRGRVMGAYTWIFFGFMPLGALWTGAGAEHVGTPDTVLINAILAFLIAMVFWFRFPYIRKE